MVCQNIAGGSFHQARASKTHVLINSERVFLDDLVQKKITIKENVFVLVGCYSKLSGIYVVQKPRACKPERTQENHLVNQILNIFQQALYI